MFGCYATSALMDGRVICESPGFYLKEQQTTEVMDRCKENYIPIFYAKFLSSFAVIRQVAKRLQTEETVRLHQGCQISQIKNKAAL